MTAASANVFLRELHRIHRDFIFPLCFKRLQFGMVASFECEIARTNNVIRLNSTTFWMTADRDSSGMMQMMYDDELKIRIGHAINNESLTAACGQTGDINIVIGFSPTVEEATKAVRNATPYVFAPAKLFENS
jgi:hypothetical protein